MWWLVRLRASQVANSSCWWCRCMQHSPPNASDFPSITVQGETRTHRIHSEDAARNLLPRHPLSSFSCHGTFPAKRSNMRASWRRRGGSFHMLEWLYTLGGNTWIAEKLAIPSSSEISTFLSFRLMMRSNLKDWRPKLQNWFPKPTRNRHFSLEILTS